jgi:phosphoribosyl 1,2-cyclic phosphodiesterase
MLDTIRFWGVRGSIASPGPHTAGAGGNTSCLEVRLGGERIIIDAGTGLRQLGMACGDQAMDAWLLLGHLHWDHIQGFPFLGALFNPASHLRVVGPRGTRAALTSQMSGPSFPVRLDQVAARLEFQELSPGQRLDLGPVTLATAPLNHPGGGLAYRLEHGARKLVYACDTEHPDHGNDPALEALARGAGILIHDAQYLPGEYPSKKGWGHSTYEAAAALALAAEVPRLLLTHHDPARDDLALARLERDARTKHPGAQATREGDIVEIGGWAEQDRGTGPRRQVAPAGRAT